MVSIFYLSHRQLPQSATVFPDHLLHFVCYFVFNLLAIIAFYGAFHLTYTVRLISSAWGFTVLYAASDEWHQSFIPGRYCSLDDFIADIMGAFVASALAFAVITVKKGK